MHYTYLESSKGVGFFLCTVHLLCEDGPLCLLVELLDTELIHLERGERREGERGRERGREGERERERSKGGRERERERERAEGGTVER